MSAEIVVVIENENFRTRAGLQAEAISRGEATDSATDDKQVVVFGGVDGFTEGSGLSPSRIR
jgi:hypothetical protein